MSPRLKLRSALTPLALAGALWAGSALTPVLGAGHGAIVNRGGAQTPPPCRPDGMCIPSPHTFGFYQTRWRTFPGDATLRAPTPAEQRAEEARDALGGPELPEATEEGQVGPAPTEREGAPGAEGAPAEGEEDAAAAGLGGLPGELPLGEGLEIPGVTPPPESGPAPGEEGPANGPQPGAEPGADPLDPFGNAPPAPPAWITSAANSGAPQQPLAPLPVVEHAAVIGTTPAPTATATNLVQPVEASMDTALSAAPFEIQMPIDALNLHGDDAPPLLPPALASGAGVMVGPAAASARGPAAPVIQQPPRVEPVVIDDHVIVDDQVEAASAEQPMGIQLVNPAAAIVDPNAEGLQQAIYFEASDR